MSPWVVLARWPAVPYWIVLGAALVFALLQLSGLLGLVAGDHETDADVDADAHLDHDADLGDAHAETDADADADDAESDAAQAWLPAALANLGVGRVPLSIVWQSFALAFGFTGLSLELALSGLLASGWLAFALSLAPSFAAGYALTRALARVLERALSPTLATSRAELTGQIGVVISSQVDADFGEIKIADRSGHVLRLVCRSSGAVIPQGREVVVLETGEGRALVDAFDEPPAAR